MSVYKQPSPAQAAVGRALRKTRETRGLSLREVELDSEGAFKAVVVGSYERGDRAITVGRLVALAAFYNVPPASLLPGGTDTMQRAASLDTAAEVLKAEADRLRGEPS